jgi:hypothetical protein
MRTLEEIASFDNMLLEIEHEENSKYRYYEGANYHISYASFLCYIKQINAIRMHDYIMDSIPKRVPHMPAMAFADEDFIKKLQKGKK